MKYFGGQASACALVVLSALAVFGGVAFGLSCATTAQQAARTDALVHGAVTLADDACVQMTSIDPASGIARVVCLGVDDLGARADRVADAAFARFADASKGGG